MGQDKLNKLSDDQLLALIKEGNRLAFDHVYNRYWKKLFAYAFNILNEKVLVEDALHEVFTRIWLNKDSIEIANLQNYLFVSVRNKSISLLSKVKFTEFDEHIMDTLSLSPEGEDHLNYQDLKATIEDIAKELPNRCREIFFMSRYKGYSNAEIARHFQISHRTVENQLSIALKHIRSAVSKNKANFNI
ncbi:RNA polymerase sigma-70 factor [Rapidithrix thailandica]|uniref:RNA polymerase sigma-70 factor n=1 Tax=Rapidithrix thailandica TaxID=413964 RepID=A0AAW9SKM7_9BACT